MAVLLALLLAAGEVPLELPPPPWLHKSAEGTLVLRPLTKGALVQIDGREAGAPPFKLAPGKHLLRVTRPGHAPLEKRITVLPGRKLQLAANLVALAGVLEVVGETRVLIDGKEVGAAPLHAFELKPGKHVISLDGVEQQILVKAGAEYRLRAPVASVAPEPEVEAPPLVFTEVAPPLVMAKVPAPRPAVAPPPKPAPVLSEPVTKKWWFWGGAAVAAAALGAVVTVALPALYNERRDPAAACAGTCGIVVNK